MFVLNPRQRLKGGAWHSIIAGNQKPQISLSDFVLTEPRQPIRGQRLLLG